MQHLMRIGGGIVGLLAAIALTVAGFLYLGLFLFTTIVLLVALPSITVVPEHHIFVVESRFRKSFKRVLYPGRYYVVLPHESVREDIDMFFVSSGNITVKGLKSADSFSHTIEISASGRPDLTTASPEALSTLVKLVNNKTLSAIFSKKLESAVREVLGRYDADTLSRGHLLARFNEMIKERLNEKLAFFTVSVFGVEIGRITPVEELQKARVAVKQRELESSVMINTMTQLRNLLISLSDHDKAIILNMEQTRMMAQGRATIIHNNQANTPAASSRPYYVIPQEITTDRNIDA